MIPVVVVTFSAASVVESEWILQSVRVRLSGGEREERLALERLLKQLAKDGRASDEELAQTLVLVGHLFVVELRENARVEVVVAGLAEPQLESGAGLLEVLVVAGGQQRKVLQHLLVYKQTK